MEDTIKARECTAAEYPTALADTGVQHVSFLQAPFYAEWQKASGKTVVYFVVTNSHKTLAAGIAVRYNAPGLSYFYCPYGPVAAKWTPELVATLREFFRPICARYNASFLRLDGNGLTDAGLRPALNHVTAMSSLQPRSEWVLDISGDQEALWMAMHKHARYNVRLAERADAKLEFFAPADTPVDAFLSLMQTTAGRDGFGLNTTDYYRSALANTPADNGFVALCTIQGTPAAIALFAAYAGEMHYVFAGSSNDFRKIAPPYYLLWNSILEGRKRGWRTLNFGGITDKVKSTHLQGVTSFKKRFGGCEVTHPNPVDLVYRPIRYQLFSWYKKLQ